MLVGFILIALSQNDLNTEEPDYEKIVEDYLHQCKCFGIDIDIENKILTVKGRDQQDISVYRDIQVLMASYYGIINLEESPLFIVDDRVILEYGWTYVKT